MRSTLLATFVLLGATFAALAPTASAADAGQCITYLYIADYHWYYVCVDPKGGTCAVYTQERHGMTWSPKQCLVESADAGALLGGPGTTCIPTSGGMDYPSYLCVAPGNVKCAVYTETSSDWGVQRRCYGVL